jgi:hypothetical protein
MLDPTLVLQFATPFAVIVAAVYQQMISNKVLAKQQKVETKVDEVHTLTNDRMSKMMVEVADLKAQLAKNQISSMDDRLKRIEESASLAAIAATKTVTIMGTQK